MRRRQPGSDVSASSLPWVDREPPEGADPVYAAYLRAKGAAGADVRFRVGLDWTILCPGRLIDEPSTGLVKLAELTGRGEVPRDDVAAVLTALLAEPGTPGALWT